MRVSTILATNVVDGTVFAYAYDDIGNRLWSREFGTNTIYAANGLNQYTEIVRGVVAEHPAFDADGNQTDIVTGTGRWLVEYNGENRPVRWTRPADGMVLEMAYDSRGRRVSSNSETFVYDDYLNVGTTVWDPTEKVATRPIIFQKEGMHNWFYTHDGNKNISECVSTFGEQLIHYGYSPWGEFSCSSISNSHNGRKSDDIVNPYKFSSEYFDAVLASYYYNYRHYDIANGRWVGRDLFSQRLRTQTSRNALRVSDSGGVFFNFYNMRNGLRQLPNHEYLFCVNAPTQIIDQLGEMSLFLEFNYKVSDFGLFSPFQRIADKINDLENCLSTIMGWVPGGKNDSNLSDGYRHCMASCDIAKACGTDVAFILGFIKETRDLGFGLGEDFLMYLYYNGYLPYAWVPRFASMLSGGSLEESIQDYLSNYDGLICGGTSNCEKCCCESNPPRVE